MEPEHVSKLWSLAGESLTAGCSMAHHTTFKVGGDAEFLYEARDELGLGRVVAFLTETSIPYVVVGRGSNLLVNDGGIEGVVIVLGGDMAGLRREGADGTELEGRGGGCPSPIF